MATITKQTLQVVGQMDDWDIQTYPEAASQDFIKGAPVVLASGKVTEAGSDVGAAAIWGFALADATGVTDAPCRVIVANPQLELEGNYAGTDGALKATAVALYGTTLGLLTDTPGNYVITDTTTGLTGCVKVKACSPKDAVGDTGGRLIVTLLSAKCAKNV